MAIDTYAEWVGDGKPWRNGAALAQFAAVLRGYGYTVWTLGDSDHLRKGDPDGSKAEDHAPYSHTPWPGPQPYPYVLAGDIPTTHPAGTPTIYQLAGQIYADKQAKVPGTEWVKYLNWEPSGPGGPCYHDSWQPGHDRRSSTDRGHIHISSRTDYATKAGTRYDPVARWQAKQTGEDDMELIEKAWLYNASSISAARARMQDTAPVKDSANQPQDKPLVMLDVRMLKDLDARVNELAARPPVEVDYDKLADAIFRRAVTPQA